MFDGISLTFFINTILGIVFGVILIRYKDTVANLMGDVIGTRVFRDADNPFTYLVIGWLFIIFEVGYLALALFS